MLTYSFKYKMWYDGENETSVVGPEFQSVTLHYLFINTAKPQYAKYSGQFLAQIRGLLNYYRKGKLQFVLILPKMLFPQVFGCRNWPMSCSVVGSKTGKIQ